MNRIYRFPLLLAFILLRGVCAGEDAAPTEGLEAPAVKEALAFLNPLSIDKDGQLVFVPCPEE